MTIRAWTENDLTSAGRALIDQWKIRALRAEAKVKSMSMSGALERDRSIVADGINGVAADWSDCPTDPAEIKEARMPVHWRTIDSAPTNGTPVLIKGGEYITETANVCALEVPIVASYYDLSESPYGKRWKWANPNEHFNYYGFGVRNPTHWSPL